MDTAGARVLVVLLALASTVAAAQGTSTRIDPCIDTSGHTARLVNVAPDVQDEVLDWGGKGAALILLPGLGNTAHVFDHFAHQFTDRFHVIGITRRGFGASSHPDTGYDIATRAHDILAVADALGLDRLVLVGHSIAGDEITRFAASYPTRTSAVVYIDAAYDRTKQEPLPEPEPPTITDHDQMSVENWSALLAREHNIRGPDAEVCNTRFVSTDGRVGGLRTLEDVPARILKAVESPDYSKLKVPALALYTRPDVHRMFPGYDDYSLDAQTRVDRLVKVGKRYQEDSIRGLKAELAQAEVQVLDGGLYLFLTNEADVARLVRGFLKRAVR